MSENQSPFIIMILKGSWIPSYKTLLSTLDKTVPKHFVSSSGMTSEWIMEHLLQYLKIICRKKYDMVLKLDFCPSCICNMGR